MNCERCGQDWPDSSVSTLGGGCPYCLLALALTDDDTPALDSDPCDHDAPLTHLGPYTLMEILGQGGMGVVYRARHEGLGRDVALKVLKPDCAKQGEFPLRFQREGQLLAGLAHPHIVGVHDLGCDSGVYYLAMERVPGPTLRQLLGRGPLPWRSAIAIFSQVCDALQFAHDRGIVHRDVKPENILLQRQGDAPEEAGSQAGAGTSLFTADPSTLQAKLGDFGIAKLVAGEDATYTTLTQTSLVLGTRAYMAPEQLEPGKQSDLRTDVYALAVVLYEMFTGELPLGVFAPPSRKAAVDPRIDSILFRALDKDPQRRFRSAAEFKERVLQVANRPARRGSKLVRLTAAAAALLAAGGLVSAFVGHPSATETTAIVRAGPAEPTHAITSTARTQPEVRHPWKVLAGHKKPVRCVAFSRDGKMLATASEDHSAKLWNPQDGTVIDTLPAFPGHFGPLSLAFSPNGKLLATGGGDNAVRIWDVGSRRELWTLPGHGREVTAVAFAPDGVVVASGGNDKFVKLWDITTGKEMRTLQGKPDGPLPGRGHDDQVLCLAYSPTGRQVASGAMKGDIKVWDPATGAVLETLGHSRRVWALAYSQDGTRLVSGSYDKAMPVQAPNGRPILHRGETMKIWHMDTKPVKCVPVSVESEVGAVAFSPDGTMIASGSNDGVVRLWDAVTGKCHKALTAHTAPVVSVAFSPSGQQLASGSLDNTAILWDLKGLE